MANIVINKDPLAEFLDSIPKMIMEARMYRDELDWKTEQRELDRQYQTQNVLLQNKLETQSKLEDRKWQLENSLSQLGVISDSQQKLDDSQQSEGFSSINNVNKASLEEQIKELSTEISTQRSSIADLSKTQASYFRGKNLFKQLDIDEDGEIDPKERESYINTYKNEVFDFDAFEKGILSAELSPDEIIELRTKKAGLYETELKNEYLRGNLESDKTYREVQIVGMELDNEAKVAENRMINDKYKLAKQELALNEIRIQDAQQKLDQSEYSHNQTINNNIGAGAESSLASAKESAKAISLRMLNNIGFIDYDKENLLPLYQEILNNPEESVTNIVQDLDSDYTWSWDHYAEAMGTDAASIKNDVLGIAQALDLSMEGGVITNSQIFLEQIDRVYTEIDELTNLRVDPDGKTYSADQYAPGMGLVFEKDIIVKGFKRDTGRHYSEDPEAFIEYIREHHHYDFDQDDEIVQFLRYLQFEEIGLLKDGGEALFSVREVLDSINRAKNIKGEIDRRNSELP